MERTEFPLNYRNEYAINITPDASEPTWARIAAGITTVDPAFEDETDDTAYYNGEGFGNETVTGVKASLTFTGHRLYGDPAQDFVESISFEVGARRETQFKWTQPNNKTVVGDVAISNIKGTGGDANAKSDFEFTVTFNGKPKVTEGEDSNDGGVEG